MTGGGNLDSAIATFGGGAKQMILTLSKKKTARGEKHLGCRKFVMKKTTREKHDMEKAALKHERKRAAGESDGSTHEGIQAIRAIARKERQFTSRGKKCREDAFIKTTAKKKGGGKRKISYEKKKKGRGRKGGLS